MRLALARVVRSPQHPDWFAAIAAGWRAGRSPLGTPLLPLAPEDAVAVLETEDAPAYAAAGQVLALPVVVRNAGAASWPTSASAMGEWALKPPNPMPEDTRYTVRLIARWRRVDARDAAGPPPQPIVLPRDVPGTRPCG